jgi:hypothetical protein
MKKVILLLSVVLLSSCSSIRVVDSWKNDEVLSFKPQKILVLGVTDNLTARKIFESKLAEEFERRNISASESTEVFDGSFTNSEKTNDEIDRMEGQLKDKGFDAVIISVVKGVDENRNYSNGYYTVNYNWRRFGRYYYRYQNIYYNPGYYNEFKTYHVETSIYNVKEDDKKSLVWVGALDIVDPQNISDTVNEYVAKIVQQLEKEGVITKL